MKAFEFKTLMQTSFSILAQNGGETEFREPLSRQAGLKDDDEKKNVLGEKFVCLFSSSVTL